MKGGYIKPNYDKNDMDKPPEKRKIISFRIAVSLGRDPKTKKYDYKWKTVQSNKISDARKQLTELMRLRDQGKLSRSGKGTLSNYLDLWLKDYVKPNLSPRTAEEYESTICNHIKPGLGDYKLTELKPAIIQGYYTEKLKNYSNQTVKNHHCCLHGALKQAVKLGLLTSNPDDATTPPKVQHTEMRIMSESDVHLFLEMASKSQYYTLFYLALFTGMRRGELLGLHWGDIDLLGMQISVSRTLHQLSSGEIKIKNPKTDKSRRQISLTPSTCEILRIEYAKQKELYDDLIKGMNEEERKAAGLNFTDDNYVFADYKNNPFLPSSVSHAWMKIARRCGLNGIRLHDSRHSHASLMLKAGIHPKIVSERLGHSSITVTLDIYSHVIPGLQQAAANKFDDLLLPKRKEEKVESK